MPGVFEDGLRIGQLAVDAKTNEIKALPELNDLLDIEGHMVSLDAIGRQKATAQKFYLAKADYLLALRGNQGVFHKRVENFIGSHQHITHAKEQGKVITTSDEKNKATQKNSPQHD